MKGYIADNDTIVKFPIFDGLDRYELIENDKGEFLLPSELINIIPEKVLSDKDKIEIMLKSNQKDIINKPEPKTGIIDTVVDFFKNIFI